MSCSSRRVRSFGSEPDPARRRGIRGGSVGAGSPHTLPAVGAEGGSVGAKRSRDGLIDDLRSGDPEAFATLVRREVGRLLATARRITDSEADAQDCVQEAFMQAHRRLDQFEGRASVSSWLHRILVNVALHRIRVRSRRPEASLDELMPVFDDRGCRIREPLGGEPPDAVTLLERADTRAAVRDAIAHLPEQYRQIVVLRDIEGLSTAAAAAELGLTENAAKVRLHRARAALKRLLEPAMGVERSEEDDAR